MFVSRALRQRGRLGEAVLFVVDVYMCNNGTFVAVGACVVFVNVVVGV